MPYSHASRRTLRWIALSLLSLLLVFAALVVAARWPSTTHATSSSDVEPMARIEPLAKARPTTRARPRAGRDVSDQLPRLSARAPEGLPVRTGAELLAGLHGAAKDDALLHRAEQLAIAECMAERGFTYEPEPYDDEAQRAVEFERIAPGDRHAASAVGYGIADGLDQEAPSRPSSNHARLAKLSEAERTRWNEALYGRDSKTDDDPDLESVAWDEHTTISWNRNSCAAQAQREVHGDAAQRVAFLARLDQAERTVRARAERDPAYQTALARWRACMGKSGHRYDKPDDAVAGLSDKFASGELSREQLRTREVEVASADARCFNEADLGGAEAAATARAEAGLDADERAALASLAEQHEGSVASARAWLEAHGGEADEAAEAAPD